MQPQDDSPRNKTGLVLALSGGGAAGLAHVGVLQMLAENSIPVRAVAGSSIGAEIGAFFASGMPMDELERLATTMDWKQTLQLFMPDLPTGGFVSGRKIIDYLNKTLGVHNIEDLAIGFAAVTADLESGEQVVIDRGGLVDAVRASISIPGIIAPHRIDRRWLVDGGVVNPIPFDVAREHFGGPVLAVGVHAAVRDRARRHPSPPSGQWRTRVRQLLRQPWMKRAGAMQVWLEAQLEDHPKRRGVDSPWTARRVLDQVMAITRAEIVRLRAGTSPPDLLLEPDVGDIGVLEFYRGYEAIAAGRAATRKKMAEIKGLLETGTGPQGASRNPVG
jgi:NTE family protein